MFSRVQTQTDPRSYPEFEFLEYDTFISHQNNKDFHSNLANNDYSRWEYQAAIKQNFSILTNLRKIRGNSGPNHD